MGAYLFDFVLLAIFYGFLYRVTLRKRDKQYQVKFTLLYLYLCAVIYVTLMPFPLLILGSNPNFLQTINWIPFIDIRCHYGGAVREAVLNTVMLVPFGFLLPALKKRNGLVVAFFSLLLSVSIEATQLLYAWGWSNSRRCDITDVITNTAGGICGYVMFRICRWMLKRYKQCF